MKNVCRFKLLLLCSAILPGCASVDVYHNLPFDKSANSLSMAPGSSGLSVKLKNFFKNKGFEIYSDGGDIITKEQDSKTKVTTTQHKTRYRLAIQENRTDSCITGGGMYVYSLSLIDMQKGQEVLSMGGRACEGDIVERLAKELGY